MWGQVPNSLLCVCIEVRRGCCPVSCGKLNSIPGLCPLDVVASHTPSFGDQKMSADIARCPPGTESPPVESQSSCLLERVSPASAWPAPRPHFLFPVSGRGFSSETPTSPQAQETWDRWSFSRLLLLVSRRPTHRPWAHECRHPAPAFPSLLPYRPLPL